MSIHRYFQLKVHPAVYLPSSVTSFPKLKILFSVTSIEFFLGFISHYMQHYLRMTVLPTDYGNCKQSKLYIVLFLLNNVSHTCHLVKLLVHNHFGIFVSLQTFINGSHAAPESSQD